MLSKVVVLPGPEFRSWVGEGMGAVAGAAERGAKIAREQGCLGCHSADGSPLVGPTFKGLLGRKTAVATGGRERVLAADEAYIRRSILSPRADLVAGYPDAMPPFEGVLKEAELSDLVEYLKGLQ
jgi:cytochrome c oxidase subunit 2